MSLTSQRPASMLISQTTSVTMSAIARKIAKKRTMYFVPLVGFVISAMMLFSNALKFRRSHSERHPVPAQRVNCPPAC
jgi:uncharacterized membrane protein